MNRNKRKRKARGGRASNPNQKYSTVPRNDAVEVGEIGGDGTSVSDLKEDGEQLDYLEVASPLQEKLNDFVEGGKGGPPGSELRSSLNPVASREMVSMDSKKMSPVLWRTLPKELLLLVLARLPLPDITRLRSLSKEWNRDMATVNSEINRVLDETSPKMVASLSRREVLPWSEGYRESKREYLVTIWSQRSQYSYSLHLENPVIGEDRWHDMGAFDGGLACFASTWKPSKANPLCIVVVNLLTRAQRKLPPLKYVYLTPPKMMHIEVDSETKCYRVVVVAETRKGRRTVEMYDSGARQWTKGTPPLGFICGLAYNWEYVTSKKTFRSTGINNTVYDSAEGQLKYGNIMVPYIDSTLMFEHHKDCMFLLHGATSDGEFLAAEGYCITKFCNERLITGDWVQGRSYLCSPFEDFLEKGRCSFTLRACEDFFFVFPSSRGSGGHFWLLDLSTGEWSSLPNCFERHDRNAGFMSRALWNVVP